MEKGTNERSQITTGLAIAVVTALLTSVLSFAVQSKIEQKTALMRLDFEVYQNTVNVLTKAQIGAEEKYIQRLRYELSRFSAIGNEPIPTNVIETCLISFEGCFDDLNKTYFHLKDAPSNQPLVDQTESVCREAEDTDPLCAKIEELNRSIQDSEQRIQMHTAQIVTLTKEQLAISRCLAFDFVRKDFLHQINTDLILADNQLGTDIQGKITTVFSTKCNGEEDTISLTLTKLLNGQACNNALSELMSAFNRRYR